MNGNTEISSDAKYNDDEVDDYDPVTSAKNIKSNSEMVMDTTESVPNKESKFVNGEDDFGNYDHLNNGPVVKEGESEMETTENETEFDDMPPSDPHISSADNGMERDEMDLAEDRDLDERLASLAKTSDLLHSTAQAVVDFKDDADDVLENEVRAARLSRIFFSANIMILANMSHELQVNFCDPLMSLISASSNVPQSSICFDHLLNYRMECHHTSQE